MRSSETTAKWLAVLRIYTGAFWLIHGVPKFLNTQFMSFLPEAAHKMASGPPGPYQAFMIGTVAPHADLFAQFIRAGEVLVGVSLLLGLVTRAGAIGGMFLALNYMLAKGAMGAIDTYASLDAAAFALSFFHLVLPTAAVLSIDSRLRGRRRRR